MSQHSKSATSPSSVDLTEGLVLTSAENPTEAIEPLGPILARYFGLNTRDSARSKTWSSWTPDPLVFVGSSTGENLAQIEDITLTMTEAHRYPNLRLWAYLEYKRTSLGWKTIRQNQTPVNFSTMKLLLNNSTGGVVFDSDVPNEYKFECSFSQSRINFTFDIQDDIYDIVTGAHLVTTSLTFLRC